MASRLRSSVGRSALALLILAAACDQETTTPTPVAPELTAVTVAAPLTALAVAQTTTATAAGLDQKGEPFAVDSITWSTSAPAVATVSQAGLVTAMGAGTAQIVATSSGRSGQIAVTVAALPGVRFNEVESNGGTPGDWAEIFNPTSSAVDLSGFVFKDNDDTHSYALPAGTSVPAGGYLTLEEAAFGFGLGAVESVRLFNPFGATVDSYSWTAHATVTYARCANGAGAFVTVTVSTKGAANDCRIAVKVNEVESNGGIPGDWIELFNAGATTVDLSGYIVRDSDDTHATVLAAGSTIAAGGYLVVEEATLGYGLGGADAARLFDPAGAVIDSYEWTAHATLTYGRCPDGTGAFAATTASTKAAANVCTAPGSVTLPWPGADEGGTVDGLNVFQTNLSGLTYEGAEGAAPAVLWAVRNGPGTLYRLIFNGSIWTPDAANGWSAGKALRYTDGTGNPDSEGVTFAANSSAMYVATERNNDASTVSRSSVLRFETSGSGTSITATNDWNLTADLPVVGANLGIETITWIPDSFLTAQGFFDETAQHAYAPAEYADHGTGLFFVGVEGNGTIYVYALNHVTNVAKRVATILSGFSGVMGLEFDRELEYLWATCDDTCGNKHNILEIDRAAGSATPGRFKITRMFDRPSALPNINNEGFAIAQQSECVANRKPVFWADDGETGGHSIRRGSVPCTRF